MTDVEIDKSTVDGKSSVSISVIQSSNTKGLQQYEEPIITESATTGVSSTIESMEDADEAEEEIYDEYDAQGDDDELEEEPATLEVRQNRDLILIILGLLSREFQSI
jgi:hypothetical protein